MKALLGINELVIIPESKLEEVALKNFIDAFNNNVILGRNDKTIGVVDYKYPKERKEKEDK